MDCSGCSLLPRVTSIQDLPLHYSLSTETPQEPDSHLTSLPSPCPPDTGEKDRVCKKLELYHVSGRYKGNDRVKDESKK